jgi:hypothetical protein
MMKELTINPDGPAVKRFIESAVDQELSDSPVRHAFNKGWPVELSELEAQEVIDAIESCGPCYANMHGREHKRLALREVMKAHSRPKNGQDK